MTQLTLELRLDGAARFATFVPGANTAASRHMESAATRARGELLWLWGKRGSGKSHLLQAACRAADGAGHRAMYVPCRAPGVEDAAVLEELTGVRVVALDRVERIAGDPQWERRLFALLEGRIESQQTVLVAARVAPAAVGFALADLASRAAAAAVYRLVPLGDADRLAALVAHASARGIVLDASVAQYLLHRVDREMRELTALLDRLDDESLRAQRKLTIPFVRELLGERRRP